MKKINYLFVLMLFVALVSGGCDKEDNSPNPGGIQPADLVGNWDFQSLNFKGNLYTGCDADLNEDYDMITMDWKNVSTTKLTIYTDCMDDEGDTWNTTKYYTIENNVIILKDEFGKTYAEFEIQNVDSFDGNTLVVKMTKAPSTNVPIGGIYTLVKH